MSEMNWVKMMDCQQQLQKLSRALLTHGKQRLTTSECELLACLYLHAEENTPLALSRSSGMKKEAVSRCLKTLYGKDCIRWERDPRDERSHILFLTETGLTELRRGYETILKPFYDLWSKMGPDFEPLFRLMSRANCQISEENKEEL